MSNLKETIEEITKKALKITLMKITSNIDATDKFNVRRIEDYYKIINGGFSSQIASEIASGVVNSIYGLGINLTESQVESMIAVMVSKESQIQSMSSQIAERNSTFPPAIAEIMAVISKLIQATCIASGIESNGETPESVASKIAGPIEVKIDFVAREIIRESLVTPLPEDAISKASYPLAQSMRTTMASVLSGDMFNFTIGKQIAEIPIEVVKKLEIINFLSQQGNNGDTKLASIDSILTLFMEEYHKEEVEVNKLQSYIDSKDNTSTPEEDAFANEIADKLFAEFNLSDEDKDIIKNITGRERVGLAGLIWSGITAGMQIHTQVTGNSHTNVSALISKWISKPTSMLAMGNIFYKAIKDFEDGASPSEIFSFISQGSSSLFDGISFINSFMEAKHATLTNGKTFLETLKESYTSSNVLEQKYRYSYNFNTDTTDLVSTRFVSSDISDIIPTSTVPGTVSTLDGIGGNYKPLGSSIGNIDAPSVPKKGLTTDTPHTGGKVLGALGIATDLTWVASAIEDVVSSGSDIKPSQIMNLVGAVVCTTGDFVGLVGGPIGEVAGMVISALGSVVTAAGGLSDLDSDSSPSEIGKAVGNFFLALNPLMPSIDAIEQAIEYGKLKDSADNEIDRIIYDALHKIASLDATPIINLTHFAYNDEIKDDAIDELMDKFGTFDNMMKEYITSDKEFSNDLNKAADFLKRNANTEHTQFLTAYLTPSQIKSIFGNETDYREGYDIRNVDTNLKVKGDYDENLKAYDYQLKLKSGIEVLPAGARLQTIDGRDVLDTISLGFGTGKEIVIDETGKEIKNPRVIDTSTWLSYNKDQLKMFSNEFKNQHTERYISGYTSGGMIPGGAIVGKEAIYSTRTEPKYERFKCWIDLVDDMSGLPTFYRHTRYYNTGYGTMNPQHEEVVDFSNLGNVNNRVIATISDIIYTNIETKAGDDDVILSNIQRVYDDGTGDSIVKSKADGGDGMDILDISSLKETENQQFGFEYSIKDNNLSYIRELGDGKDYNLNFSNFEEVRLTKENNKITIKDNSDIELSEGQEPEELRLIGTSAKVNDIDFSGVKGKSLYFQGSLDGVNNIKGTENNDVIVIPEIEDKTGTGSSEIFANGGNDMIMGGNITKNLLHGGDGIDYIKATGNNNEIWGDSGRDFLQGSDVTGTHILNGGMDNDTLMAGKAGATLNGDEGSDLLNGNDGQDILNGGTGNDYIQGGAGSDTFIFSKDFGKDTIKDYESGEKIIFDNTSGINSIDDFEFIKNQEQSYLALIYDDKCLKLNGWDSNDKLDITIGDTTVDASKIESLIQSATNFNEYKIPDFLSVQELGLEHPAYFPNTQHSEVYSNISGSF
ncbi:calcium-binding protein [Clostridium sp. Marseille-Q2269]|uniref:calcium-binding protein n=1 Tax=Clostridium sp. Marseille-Q2269 TaxID=2942205 RepID=UPI002072BE96|nr:calcium-binding protein [Clostridium sp. Marseille-Q2269]